MTHRERILAALRHQPVDRLPKGEIGVEAELANRLMGTNYPLDFQHYERELAIRNFLDMDIIVVGDWPSWPVGVDAKGRTIYRSNYGYDSIHGATQHVVRPPVDDIEDADQYQKPDISKVNPALIRKCAEETDLFVFAQIGGPVSMLNEMFDMEDYMVYCMTNPDEMLMISDKVIEYEIEKAKLFLDAGADGIFLADDIAFNSGTLLPHHTMDRLVFPYYKEMIKQIKAYKDVPIVFHSDGNLNAVMEKIVDCGFDGLHSLQPSAGMDIGEIKRKYGDKLCLWGNLDLNYIMSFGTTEEVKETVRKTVEEAGYNSGFILATCNVMINSIPEQNILAMMEAARDF